MCYNPRAISSEAQTMYFVYKATNTENGKSYIGITSRTTWERWMEHVSRARCGARNSRIYDAIRKYGKDRFEVTTIDRTDCEDTVRGLESKYIAQYDTYENGYNCNYGGCGYLEFPEEIRQKISASQKGKIIPESVKEKMSLAKLGDSRCAENLGKHTNQGKRNPRAKWYLVRTPDGEIVVGRGLRDFCRENNLPHCKFSSKKKSKGFNLLGTFNDYPAREYSQVTGSAVNL